MTKRRVVICLTLILSVVLAGTALANGGPHGGYTSTTDGCAGCHRAHTGVAANLLVETSTSALCLSCHGSGATGADTNVIDGIYEGTAYGTQNAGLNGGGFSYAKMNVDYTGAVSGTVTSKHTYDGSSGTAWGGGSSGPGTTMTLDCANCHDPHGNSNYRILKASLATVAQTDESTKDYTDPTYGTGTAWGLSTFCVSCHTQYMTESSTYNAGDGKGSVTRYRHKVDVDIVTTSYSSTMTTTLPLGDLTGNALSGAQGPGTNTESIICLTCHVAHGTSATMSGQSQVAPASDSALLRLNNRGICEDCHGK